MSDKKEIAIREKEEIKKEDGEPTHSGVYYSPEVDIFETEDVISLIADMPGVDKQNLDIDLKEHKLTISGLVHRPEERLDPVYSEYGIGGYMRSFRLGDAIDESKINAFLKEGVLTLVLQKADRLKPRKIDVITT